MKICKVLNVSKSEFYAWMKEVPSKRELENHELLKEFKKAYDSSKGEYGSVKIKNVINNLGPKIRHYKVEKSSISVLNI